MTRASTAIGVSPIIKDLVQKKALATRLTLKEIIYVGMLAIDELEEKRLQELADKVHQMQVNGEIWGIEENQFNSFIFTTNHFSIISQLSKHEKEVYLDYLDRH